MTITNLTAKESNGVVVAHYTWGNCKVRLVFPVENLITEDYSVTVEHIAEYDLIWILTHKYIKRLAEQAQDFINFNLQEAE